MAKAKEHLKDWKFIRPELRNFLEYMDINYQYSISSLYRPNDLQSEHSTGEGVDIRCANSRDRFYLVSLAVMYGCTRIGIYDQHIHFGFADWKDQDVLWTGISK